MALPQIIGSARLLLQIMSLMPRGWRRPGSLPIFGCRYASACGFTASFLLQSYEYNAGLPNFVRQRSGEYQYINLR